MLSKKESLNASYEYIKIKPPSSREVARRSRDGRSFYFPLIACAFFAPASSPPNIHTPPMLNIAQFTAFTHG